MPLHRNAAGTDLHEAKRLKEPVRAASTANVSLATPGATLDGVTLAAADRVLLKNQTTQPDNGIYVWSGAAVALVRAADATASSDFGFMFIVGVREGTVNAGSFWVYRNTTTLTIGVDSLSFTNVQTSTFGTEVTASDFNVTGLTGVVAASRYVGAVSGTVPASGTFAVGDYVVDRTLGGYWVCTTAGSPGTWRPVGGPASTAASRMFLATTCT
jgi:hypothetical protein